MKAKLKNMHRITWSFFAAHHGKSNCDTRSANAKATLKRHGLASPDVISGPHAFADIVSQTRNTQSSIGLLYLKRPAGNAVKLLTPGVIRAAHFFEHVGNVDVSANVFTLQACKLAEHADTDEHLELKLEPTFALDLTRDGTEMDSAEKTDKFGQPISQKMKRKREEQSEQLMARGAAVEAAFAREGKKK
jgi:hypothetical protein